MSQIVNEAVGEALQKLYEKRDRLKPLTDQLAEIERAISKLERMTDKPAPRRPTPRPAPKPPPLRFRGIERRDDRGRAEGCCPARPGRHREERGPSGFDGSGRRGHRQGERSRYASDPWSPGAIRRRQAGRQGLLAHEGGLIA